MKQIGWIALLLLACELVLACLLWAGNTHAPTGDVATEQRAWWGDALTGGYVVASPAGMCQHTTSATTSASVSSCRMYATNTGPPRQIEYIEDLGLRTVNYNTGDGTYWLVAHASINEVVSAWTRVQGTHYLWRQSATQPSLPNRANWLLRATVSGSAITAVLDLRTVGSPVTGTFIALTDTPATYTGQALKGLRVNAAETAVEFSDIVGGGGDSVQVNSVGIDTTANFTDAGEVAFVRGAGGAGGPDTITALLKADIVGPSQLADLDFGDWTCNDAAGGCVLDTNSVTSAKILDGTLLAGDFSSGAVTSTALASGSVTLSKMANEDHGDFAWIAGVGTVQNVQCSNCISDTEVIDTLTASNYLPLAGGTMTGQIGASNLGIEFQESDVNPPCGTGNYTIFADASEQTLKLCLNGALTVVGGGVLGDSLTINGLPIDTTANLVNSTGLTWQVTEGPAGGPDTVSLLLHAALLDLADGTLTGSRVGVISDTAVLFPVGNPTPDITTTETSFWVSTDTTVYTDFIDGDDHSEFSETRWLFLTFQQEGGGLACSNTTTLLCNNGTDWTANAGDVASCLWSPHTEVWFCQVPATASGSEGVPTLDQVFDAGKSIDGATSLANAMKVGGTTQAWYFYQDGAGILRERACNVAGTTCVTAGIQMEVGSDWSMANESGTVCGSFDSVTGAWTGNTSGTCTPNLVTTAATETLSNKTLVAPTVQGGSSIRQKTTVNTNPYTMQTSDCGKTLFIETGAGEIDLIADPTGGITNGSCLVCFYERAAITLLLDPNSTDIIQGTDNTGTALTLVAGDRLQLANVIGNNVCLQGYDASTWLVWPGIGTLSDGN